MHFLRASSISRSKETQTQDSCVSNFFLVSSSSVHLVFSPVSQGTCTEKATNEVKLLTYRDHKLLYCFKRQHFCSYFYKKSSHQCLFGQDLVWKPKEHCFMQHPPCLPVLKIYTILVWSLILINLPSKISGKIWQSLLCSLT